MRIEFTPKVSRSLFQRYTLLDDRSNLGESLLEEILQACSPYMQKTDLWSEEEINHFQGLMAELSQPGNDTPYSRLREVEVDLLFWFKVQNLFHGYFTSLGPTKSPSEAVLVALNQIVQTSQHTEYFSLTDCIMSAIQAEFTVADGKVRNYQLLSLLVEVQFSVQLRLSEQKRTLRFFDNFEFQQNLRLKSLNAANIEIQNKTLNNFLNCLTWLTDSDISQNHARIEQHLKKEFQEEQVESDMIEYVFASFKCLVTDRIFGQPHDPEYFLEKVPAFNTIDSIIKILKNANGKHSVSLLIHAVDILCCLVQIDLLKEFKTLSERKNPYFKETCKHFNFLAQTLKVLTDHHTKSSQQQAQSSDEMQIDQSNDPTYLSSHSQQYLYAYLIFLQALIEIKTREMQQSFYPQLFEPLVELAGTLPQNRMYDVNLGSQEIALQILKELTKKSYIFDDSNLLQIIIDRLKKELQILSEDLDPNQLQPWRPNPAKDDIFLMTTSLRQRQRFISTALNFLCYSIIRTDPNSLTQQQTFIAHSRKILESNLFEECIMELVFLKNQEPPLPNFEKVIDPVFLDCVQLYTFLGNDLPQKLGDLIDSGIVIAILQSIERRIPIQVNLLQVIIKFFKMLNLNSKGTAALLESTALEQFFGLALDHRSHKMLVMANGSNHMFDCRQQINSFANENQQISDRIYKKCMENLSVSQQKSWDLSGEYFRMETQIKDLKSEEEKAPFKEPYGKKQVNYEYILESSVALLSYFCMDELEYLEDLKTHESCVAKTIRSNDSNELLYRVMRTPIICSAADGFIYHFQESMTLINMIQNGIEGFQNYLIFLDGMLEQSFCDLFKILGTSDLESLPTFPNELFYTDLSEPMATVDQRKSLESLKSEDLVWVAVCKIHILIEMFIILGTLSKFHARLGILPVYQTFIDKVVQKEIGGYRSLIQLRNLLTRYYSHVYVEAVMGQIKRKEATVEKFRQQLENDFNWDNFQESDEPYSEFEDARNLYWRFERNTVQSLTNGFANEVAKSTFEFVLPETIGVIQTFKCYKKIETLFSQLHACYNKDKRKGHFKEKFDNQAPAFNTLNAKSTANYVRFIAKQCSTTGLNIEQALTHALLVERVLPNLTKHIGYKWRNQVNGGYLLTLVAEENIVEPLGKILEWAVNQYASYEAEPTKKSLFIARNIQVIVRDVVMFFVALLKTTYLNTNLHSFLLYFRKDLTLELTQHQATALFPYCVEMTQNLLQTKVLFPISKIVFGESLLKHWCHFSQPIQENIIKIYQTLCQGGFKDPQGFFSSLNMKREARQLTAGDPRRGWAAMLGRPRHSFSESESEIEVPPAFIGSRVTSNAMIEQFEQMGFARNAVVASLQHTGNDFEAALNCLLRGQFTDAATQPQQTQREVQIDTTTNLAMDITPDVAVTQTLVKDEPVSQVKEEPVNTSEHLIHLQTYANIESSVWNEQLELIQNTFLPVIAQHMAKVSISQRRVAVDNLFNFFREMLLRQENNKEQAFISTTFEPERLQLLENLAKQMAAETANPPDWQIAMFTVQLLSYSKDLSVLNISVTSMFFALSARLKTQIQNISSWATCKVRPENFTQPKQINEEVLKDEAAIEHATQSLYNLHLSISLMYFLITNFVNQQDIDQIKNLLSNADQKEEKSAFEEPVTFKDVEELKKELNQKPFNEDHNMIRMESQDKLQLVQQSFDNIILFFKQMANVQCQIAQRVKQPIKHVIGPAIKLLKQISCIQADGFDFRQAFMQAEAIKLIFEIKMIDSDWTDVRPIWENDKQVDSDLQELLQNVWNTPRDLQKWYETLIKRQLFFQFKANYKRQHDNSSEVKDQNEYLIAGVDAQPAAKQAESLVPKSQSKQGQAQNLGSSTKKNKSKSKQSKKQAAVEGEDNLQEIDTPGEVPAKNGVNRLLKRFEELNEQNFSDFVKYFNSQMFFHVIQHFNVFLAACSKVCYLKKIVKPVTDDQKESAFEMKIMLKRQVLKELLTDPDFNYGMAQKPILKPDYKGDISKCLSEVVNQLLEIFITQTKGYRMEIFKTLREPNLTPDSLVRIVDQKVCLAKDTRLERKIYFFDQVQILRVLTSIIVLKNGVTGLLLRHNDSKTVKFIFRNIYAMLALQVEGDPNRALTLKDSTQFISYDRVYPVISFLTNILLYNFGSSRNEKAIKKELLQLFVKQMAKGLAYKPPNDDTWSVSSGLLQNYSQIWIMAKFLLVKQRDDESKDPTAAINQKKSKFWRLQRCNITKQIILMSNNLQPTETEVPRFCLLENIQNFCQALQNPQLYLFDTNRNQCLATSINVITKILRLFENSQSLGQILKVSGPKPADYSSIDGVSDVEMRAQQFYNSDSDLDDFESSESDLVGSQGGDYMDSSSSDNDDSGNPLNPLEVAELAEMNDESFESEMIEDGWDEDESFEHELEEMSELEQDEQDPDFEIINMEEQKVSVGKPGGPRSQSENSWPSGGRRQLSRSQNSDDEREGDSEEADENSYDDEAADHNENISFHDESNFDQMGEEEDQFTEEENLSYEDDSQQDLSQFSNDSQLRNYYQDNPNLRPRNFDRRTFVFGHSQGQFTGLEQAIHLDMRRPEITTQDFFNLDENDILNISQPNSILSNPLMAPLLGPISAMERLGMAGFMPVKEKPISSTALICQSIIGLKRTINQFKSRVRATEGIYLLHITTVQQIQQPIQSLNRSDQTTKPSTSTGTADSSDLVVQNPDDFKDHMRPTTRLQLPVQASLRPSNSRNVASVSNPFIIDGMDPLFMESLSAVGLQNIADSHQIHAQISNQANYILPQNATQIDMIRDLSTYLSLCTPQRRADILRQIQNDMARDLPVEIFAEARQLYRQNRDEFLRLFGQIQGSSALQADLRNNGGNESPTRDRNRTQQQLVNTDVFNRDRLVSQDSVSLSIDLLGPTDQSQSAQNVEKIQNAKGEVTIKGTQYIQNFFIILQDLNARYEKDPAVIQVDKQSELVLQQALLPQPTESPQSQFLKIKGTVQTALTAFINLNLDIDTQLTHSIKILHRIPNLRTCLVLSVLKQARDEINSAREYVLKQKASNESTPYVCSLYFQESNGKSRSLTLSDVVLGALVTVSQLQTTIENQYGAASEESLEIVSELGKDPLIAKFAGFIGTFDLQKSVLEILIEILLDNFALVHAEPWIIPERDLKATVQIEFQIHVVNQFTQMLKPVIKMLKQKDAPKVYLPLAKICELLLNRDMLLQKRSLVQVCETLNELANIQCADEIQNYLQSRLSVKINRAMTLIINKNERVQSENTIQSQIDQIVELFTVTSGINKVKDKNICDELLLLDVFEQASIIIKAEDAKANKTAQKSVKRAVYIFKDEIKELMILIFSLCEFNLRIIFANKPKEATQHPNENLSAISPGSEVQIQTLTNETLVNKSLNNPQSIENLLESHLSPSSPDFIRFKTIISFFIENRKLINTFIQINCNVVNKELLRLALMIPQILDFDTKRIIWKAELKRLQQKYKNENFSFQIRREHTFQDSYASMFALSVKQWRGKMAVTFQGEDGIDGGGLFKEWLSNLSKDFFNEDMALFIKSAQGATYYPNPKSTVQPNHLDMFTYIGKIFGKALWDLQLLDCYFVKAFYKIMLGIPLSYHDLEDYDPALYKSLSWILNNQGVEMLSSYFVETVEYFGEQKEIELCEGGKDKLVTDENKWDYVQLVTNYRLYKAIAPQIDAFLKGLYFVLPKDLLKLFDSMELELLISGLQNIDIDDLRENTVYDNYTATSKPIQYLFEALQEFDNSERAEFIRFVTGSSKVPIEGFKGLRGQNGIQKFTVVRIPGTLQTRLPQSHTCHNQLDLPEYKDKETTKRMLLYAIREGKTFGIA